jgi:hypothetical protein
MTTARLLALSRILHHCFRIGSARGLALSWRLEEVAMHVTQSLSPWTKIEEAEDGAVLLSSTKGRMPMQSAGQPQRLLKS